MIYEYALDPALVVDWVISELAVYARQFGLDQRRLVSDFPKNWEGHVYGELYNRFDDTSVEFQNAQLDLPYYMQCLTEGMVKRDTELLSGDWINAVIAEHAIRPFYGIFCSKNDSVCLSKEMFTENDINDIKKQNIHWWLPTIKPTRKSAIEIADFLRPLLQASSKIYIVDPYFDFDPNRPRFESTLSEIINQAIKLPRAVCCIPLITIITGVERNNRNHQLTDQEAENFAKNIEERAKRHLPKELKNLDIKINLVVLKNMPKNDPLHNRYILTDIGGVIIPFGTDDYDRELEHNATDDLVPMPIGIYKARWKQYVVKLDKLEVIVGPVPIC